MASGVHGRTMRALTMKLGSDRASVAVRPPLWVDRLVDAAGRPAGSGDDIALEVAAGARFTVVSAVVDQRLVRDAAGLREATVRAYGLIRNVLAGSNTPHPVRFWNHISDITKPAGAAVGDDVNAVDAAEGPDRDCNRYMAFNAGRFAAMQEWYGGPGRFDASLPTASGVGYDGQGLIVHCLAARQAGRAVANPRQVQPHRYSVRYGPRPPCFSRATILTEDVPSPLVLVGGTASIRGEESIYDQDLAGQFQETLANLSSLLTAAGAVPGGESLAALREVRVYHRDESDAAAVGAMVRSSFASVSRPQILRAGLCRAELLVEIEGVGEWAGAGRGQ